MAARNTYTQDFILNAVLNGGFKSVFTQAQQEFIKLEAEIRKLQEIQRDIASYQKQEKAIKNTEEKLENYKRQLELTEKQIKETTGSTTALANAVKQGDIDKVKKLTGTFTNLREEQEKYAEFQADFQTSIAETTAELLSEVDGAVAGMDRSHDAANAAHSTIQAYIDEASDPDNLSAIRAAYANASAEAIRALCAAARDPFYGISPGSVTQKMMIEVGVEG